MWAFFTSKASQLRKYEASNLQAINKKILIFQNFAFIKENTFL